MADATTCRITMINHACVLIQLGATNILTDPIYNRTIGLIAPRLQKAGIPIADLPDIHIVLVSHNDYDHLSLSTLQKISRRHDARIVLPIGDAKYAYKSGFEKVVEMEQWQEVDSNECTIYSVPAQHKSNRTFFQRKKKLCLGYVIRQGDMVIYFAGDTGYGEHFKEISQKFDINVALLPIGAYKPHDWFKNIHLSPKTAIQAFVDLRADRLIPIHWGTFKISDEPMDEPPILLIKSAKEVKVEEKISILNNGDTFKMEC